MASRTAVITGALGQDGSLLSELLLSQGYSVIGVVKVGAVAPTTGPLARVKFVAADLTDPSAVRSLLETHKPHELYHLAAHHHSSQEAVLGSTLVGKDAMLATNFIATKVLAFALLNLGLDCHLVYASSSQIYTPIEPCHRIDERSPRQPSSFYGLTKSWSMDLLGALRADARLRASSAILFNHESPRRGAEFVTRKVTQAAAQAALGMRPRVQLRNIGAHADWSSARDVAAALSLMGHAAEPRDYVVGSGELRSVRDLLKCAFDHVGLDWSPFVSFQDDATRPALLSQSRALEDALGWRRTITFERMVAEMVDRDFALASAPKTVQLP
jgi:GDPmannose 4,6-dehydratase